MLLSLLLRLHFYKFLLKLSKLSAAIFRFVSLVLSLLCVYYIRMLYRHVCFVSNNLVADECDHAVWTRLSAMYAVCTTNWCCKGIKFRSRYMMFVYHCNINNPEYQVRRRFDREPNRIPVKKLGKLSSDVDIRHWYVYFSPVYCLIDLKS